MTIDHSVRNSLAAALTALAVLATLAAAQSQLNVPSHGFSVQVPEGWSVADDSADGDALYFITSPNHGGGLVIAAGPLDGPEGAAYAAEGLAGLAEPSFGIVAGLPGAERSAVKPASVSGVDAAGFTYRGTELGGRFVYFVSGELMYALGSIADAAATPTMEAALEGVLASFQFTTLGFPDGGPNLEDPFVGQFAGDGLTLTLIDSGDDYVGNLTFSGATYPAHAIRASDQTLNGTFLSGSTHFPFELVLDGDARVFTTGTSRYVLR